MFPDPSNYSTVPEIISAVINFIFALSFPILTGVVLYAAFIMLTAAGDPAKFQRGWKIILYAALGFILILLSKGLIFVLQDVLKVNVPGSGGGPTTGGRR
jgi:hypothetical protein